jgi:hypothetical protein
MLSQMQAILNKNLIKINTEITKISNEKPYLFVFYVFNSGKSIIADAQQKVMTN